jgi:hypothetical protein
MFSAVALVGCRGSEERAAPSAEYKAPPAAESALRDWEWRAVGDLREPRELPRLVKWKDGVLIVGGGSELRATAASTTEVFDPETHRWRPGPPLTHARRDAEVVQLGDGRLMAIGGSDGPTRTGTPYIELLQGESWVEGPPMADARIGHTAVVLKDGRVLVVGGQSRPDAYLVSAEVYDPASNAWSPVADMKESRSFHHTRLLHDGRVIVIGGGTDSSATDGVEIFDPGSGTWSAAARLKEPRWGFASAVLPDGRVLVAGGRVPARKGATLPEDKMVVLRGVEIYDPRTDSWSDGPPMNIPRTMGLPNVALLALEDGSLMFVAGRSYPAPYHGVRSVEVLDRGPRFLPLQQAECFEPKARQR